MVQKTHSNSCTGHSVSKKCRARKRVSEARCSPLTCRSACKPPRTPLAPSLPFSIPPSLSVQLSTLFSRLPCLFFPCMSFHSCVSKTREVIQRLLYAFHSSRRIFWFSSVPMHQYNVTCCAAVMTAHMQLHCYSGWTK